jgi:putative glycosyltransferase (TIGR04372 family)
MQLGHLLAMTHANEVRNKNWNQSHFRKKQTIYCFFGIVANEYLLKKLSENVLTLRGNLAWTVNRLARYFPSTQIYYKDDPTQNFENLDPLIKFSEDENYIGQKFIEKDCKKLVCLNVRDSAYNSLLNSKYNYSAKSWKFRNSDIDSYVDAVRKLDHLGHCVYRMGKVVEKKLQVNSPRVFDYATNNTRTEFLDVYIGSACDFVISTGSGWDEIPKIFQKPVMLANLFDFLAQSALSRSCVIYPKIFVSKETSEVFTLTNVIDLFSRVNRKNLDSGLSGFEIRDLSSEELVEAVTEMAQRVEGTFVETPEQKEMQAKLKHILSTHPKLQPTPNYYPIRAEFASCFLSRYPNFLDGLD